jgi:hypothetical protein
MNPLAEAAADEHAAGGDVGPPPAEGGVEDQPDEDRAGKRVIDQRDLGLFGQHLVGECRAGAELSRSQGEHCEAGRRELADSEG